jgi:hypothetical protein
VEEDQPQLWGLDFLTRLRSNQLNYVPTLKTQDFFKSLAGSGVCRFRIYRAVCLACPVQRLLSSIVDDLEELNIYCRRYHHGENQNAATEPVDDAELQGYVRRTLKLVGCLL